MEERRYLIKDSYDYFRTGKLISGDQVLMGKQGGRLICLVFNAAGDLLDWQARSAATEQDMQDRVQEWLIEIEVQPGTISVKAFSVPELGIEIREMPDYLDEFVRFPERFSADRAEHLSQRVAEWKASGAYVLIWDEDFEMNHDGDVEST